MTLNGAGLEPRPLTAAGPGPQPVSSRPSPTLQPSAPPGRGVPPGRARGSAPGPSPAPPPPRPPGSHSPSRTRGAGAPPPAAGRAKVIGAAVSVPSRGPCEGQSPAPMHRSRGSQALRLPSLLEPTSRRGLFVGIRAERAAGDSATPSTLAAPALSADAPHRTTTPLPGGASANFLPPELWQLRGPSLPHVDPGEHDGELGILESRARPQMDRELGFLQPAGNSGRRQRASRPRAPRRPPGSALDGGGAAPARGSSSLVPGPAPPARPWSRSRSHRRSPRARATRTSRSLRLPRQGPAAWGAGPGGGPRAEPAERH